MNIYFILLFPTKHKQSNKWLDFVDEAYVFCEIYLADEIYLVEEIYFLVEMDFNLSIKYL